MKKQIILFLVLAFTVSAFQYETTLPIEKTEKRIVSLSGFLTEVLFELGYGDNIVGVDVTSTYPAQVKQITKLGHISQLNVEAILKLKPNYICIEKSQLRQTKVLNQLKSSGIKIVTVSTSYELNNAINAANQLKKSLNIEKSAINKMAKQIKKDTKALKKTKASIKKSPKVLFIYARGAGRLMVSGTGTSADAIIKLAGGKNAIQSFKNFKPLTPESLIKAAPDVILMFESGLKSLDGKKGLAKITGMKQTPAYKNNRVIAMDGHYLTSFGPRVGVAANDLAKKLTMK